MTWATISFILVLLPCCLVVYNRLTWVKRRLHSDQVLDLSVLIPARNEERNIDELLQSLLALCDCNWIREIIVCDDGSTDATASLVSKRATQDSRIRLVSAGPLPSDWVGKPHACQGLLTASSGQHLLFVDADVRLEPDALPQLSGMLVESGGGLVTAVPRQVTGTFFEELILPLLHLTYLSWLPLNWANRRRDPRTVAACGQLLLAKRETLEHLGGFAPVRRALVDDVALARHARSSGTPAFFFDGATVARCRMYRSASEVWSGFAKNLYLGLGSPWALMIAWTLYGGAFVLPFVLLALALLPSGAPTHLDQLLIGGALAGNLIVRLIVYRAYGHTALSALLHPLAILMLLALSAHSAIKVTCGRVQWAGRNYDLKTPGPLSPGELP